MTLLPGATYQTRSVGPAMVLASWSFALRDGTKLEGFEGLLMRDGRPVRWDTSGAFYGGLGNDPYDLVAEDTT